MPHFRATNSAYDLTINDVPMMLARSPYIGKDRPAFVRTVLQPLKPGSDEFQAIQWQNGTAGAGWTRETPSSSARGGWSHGENIDGLTQGIIMPAGKLEEITLDPLITTAFFDALVYDSDLWISTSGRYLANVTGATGLSTVVGADLGVGFTSTSLHVFDGNLLTSGQGSGSIWSFDGASFTQGTGVLRSRLDDVHWSIGEALASGGLAGTAGAGAKRLIGTSADGSGFYHLASGANPLVAGNWSSLIPVSSSPYAIQSIVAANHHCWFSTPAGVFDVDGLGYTPNVTPWAQRFYNASSGAAVLFHNDYILYGHRHGLALVPTTGERQDIPHFIQFGEGTANGTPIYGRPYVMDTAGSCVYVAYGDSGTTYVMALKFTPEGVIWSGSVRTIASEQPTMLRVMDLGGRPYLLLGTTDLGGAPHLYRQSLPLTGSAYADYLQNTAHQFETDSSITLSKMDLNDSSPKEIPQYEIISENLGDGKSISLNISTDGAAYVTQGTATSSPRSVILPEADDSSGTDFQLKLDMRGLEDDPCVLRIVGARVLLQPEPIETNEYVLQFQDEGQALLTTAVKRARNAQADFRTALALPRAGTVTLFDQFGDEMRVRIRAVLNAEVREESQGKPWVGLVTLRTVVIERIIRYDDSNLYDTGLDFGSSS